MARARGSRELTLDARTLLRGVSTDAETQDGGYSPDSKGVQIFKTPGLVHSGASIGSVGSVFQANGVFAYALWHTVVSPGLGRALSSNAGLDGYFYTLDDSSGAPTQVATDTGRDYKPGISDMLKYQTDIFTTSKTDVAKSTFNFGTNDFTWWTVTRGHAALFSSGDVWHGMVEFGGVLYIADDNYLHSWDGTTSSTQVLDLPSNMTITAMTVHNGLLWIAAESYFDNLDGDYYRYSKIFTWDGFSPSWLNEFDVEERIDTLTSIGGILFVTTPRYFGFFNGNAISPLRALTTQVRKYQLTIARDRIYMAQGTDVLCYGHPIYGKQRIFSFPLEPFTSDITSIIAYKDGVLIGSSDDSRLVWSNIDGSGGDSAILYSDKIPLGAYSSIRCIELETEVLQSGDTFTLAYVDSAGTAHSVGTFSFANDGAKALRSFDVLNTEKTKVFQLKLTIAGAEGLRRVSVFYAPVEKRTGQS